MSSLLPWSGSATSRHANILTGLYTSPTAPYHRKLFALGIRHVGETVARTLAAGFPDIDTLMTATDEQLCSHCRRLARRISASVREYFADADNIEIIRRLQGCRNEL
ncbi:MAG: hypothetical protein MZV63_23090 [Marinilabiliales bacterium]|nr:hypothetical protein [Marinilabiliales bacterium]